MVADGMSNPTLLNALTAAKNALIKTSLSPPLVDEVRVARATVELYRKISREYDPQIYISKGPREAILKLQSVTNRGANLADELFGYTVHTAEHLRKQLESELSIQDLIDFKNMVFWDLNFQISQSYVQPVMRELKKQDLIPKAHAMRSASNPCLADVDWLGQYHISDHCFNTTYKEAIPFMSFIAHGGMYLFAFEHIAICCLQPETVRRNDSMALHAEQQPAVQWGDGSALYFNNGVPVPAKLVLHPDEVTREDIVGEENAEVRRCYHEILGSERFANLLGLVVLDAQKDKFGNDLILYRTEFRDKLAAAYIFFARVTCPSTQRPYFICVPPHIRDALEAVAWTFGKKAANYRTDIET